MAKKNLGLSATLNKNKNNAAEPKLGNKIPLLKRSKKLEEVAEKVAAIHKVKSGEKIASKKPIKKDTKSSKNVRITVDTPQDVHIKLKIKSIEAGITMRAYILRLINADLNKGIET